MLAGVTVTLTGVDRDGQPYTLTTTTSDTGAYELRYLNVGEHTITFGPPSGWTPTAPGGDSDAPSIKLNLSEQVTRGVDAGFRQPGEVNVTKTATVDGQPVTSVVPGTTVDYTVGITNPAERPFTDLFEAVVRDDLRGVLDDGDIVEGPNASAGRVSLRDGRLTWSGAPRSGQPVTVIAGQARHWGRSDGPQRGVRHPGHPRSAHGSADGSGARDYRRNSDHLRGTPLCCDGDESHGRFGVGPCLGRRGR